MVSYYNPVAMFGRTGTGHHHPHHPSPPQNPYFSGPYNSPAYHHHYPHSHHHQAGGPSSAPGVVTSTQFSPNVPPDCNHPYQHQLGNMTPESVAAAAATAVGWHQPNVMYSACASARNMVSAGGYEDWTHSHGYPPPHHSFYHLQQPSPPNSTPSPNSTHNGGHGSPTTGYPSHPVLFKNEFGPCSGGPQENSSQEMHSVGGNSSGSSGGVSLVSSASSSSLVVPVTPHSPDSGMAISDGVSSSGSPATTGGPHCLNNQQPHHHHQHQHHHLSSTTMVPALIGGAMIGGVGCPPNGNLNHQPTHNNHHNGGGTLGTMGSANNNNSVSTGRPTQARSPFEWMRKPTNSQVSSNSNGGKTRTKDKYRVVYSDTQRVELEKEYHYNRYITIHRKSELARILGLSERQVKIWFQNRRAKDRKTDRKHGEMINRGKEVHMHMQNAAMLSASGTMNLGNGMCGHGNPHNM